tara:strand:+ start:70 stop:177 length:108 start_codon:yes stop_codon:yes gene_type:complete
MIGALPRGVRKIDFILVTSSREIGYSKLIFEIEIV